MFFIFWKIYFCLPVPSYPISPYTYPICTFFVDIQFSNYCVHLSPVNVVYNTRYISHHSVIYGSISQFTRESRDKKEKKTTAKNQRKQKIERINVSKIDGNNKCNYISSDYPKPSIIMCSLISFCLTLTMA